VNDFDSFLVFNNNSVDNQINNESSKLELDSFISLKKKEIGEKIKRTVSEEKIVVESLAKTAGISKTIFYKIIKGEEGYRFESLLRVLFVLKIDLKAVDKKE